MYFYNVRLLPVRHNIFVLTHGTKYNVYRLKFYVNRGQLKIRPKPEFLIYMINALTVVDKFYLFMIQTVKSTNHTILSFISPVNE